DKDHSSSMVGEVVDLDVRRSVKHVEDLWCVCLICRTADCVDRLIQLAQSESARNCRCENRRIRPRFVRCGGVVCCRGACARLYREQQPGRSIWIGYVVLGRTYAVECGSLGCVG